MNTHPNHFVLLFCLLPAFFVAVIVAQEGEGNAPNKVSERDVNRTRDCCLELDKEQKELDCAALASGNRSEVQHSNTNMDSDLVVQFIFKCIAGGKDNTKCCKDNNVSEECLPLCNASSPARPFNDTDCSQFMPIILTPCRTAKTRLGPLVFLGAVATMFGVGQGVEWMFSKIPPGPQAGCTERACGSANVYSHLPRPNYGGGGTGWVAGR